MEQLVTQLLSTAKGIWKYRWYSMGVAWAVVLIGFFVVYTLPNNYQASARVFVDTQSILKPLLSGMTTIPDVEQQVSIMSKTLLSRPNVERVMRMVDLDINAKSNQEKETYVNALMSEIKITGTASHDIYSITYANANPKLAKSVVESLLTIFIEGSASTDSVPWALVVVGILLPIVIFALAFLVGLRRNVFAKALIFVVGLAALSALTLTFLGFEALILAANAVVPV